MNTNAVKCCLFCLSSKLGISNKTTTFQRKRKRHVAVYCKDCNCYGPRVLADEIPHSRNAEPGTTAKAIELWNRQEDKMAISITNRELWQLMVGRQMWVYLGGGVYELLTITEEMAGMLTDREEGVY